MKRSMVLAVMLFTALTAFGAEKRSAVPVGNSPSMGPENAPVTIVEFVDFQ